MDQTPYIPEESQSELVEQPSSEGNEQSTVTSTEVVSSA